MLGGRVVPRAFPLTNYWKVLLTERVDLPCLVSSLQNAIKHKLLALSPGLNLNPITWMSDMMASLANITVYGLLVLRWMMSLANMPV